jgi:cell division protease FtsH
MWNSTSRTITIWATLLLVTLFLINKYEPRTNGEIKKPSYSEFLDLATQGKISKVEVTPKEGNAGYDVHVTRDDASQFDVMAPAGDADLFRILRQGHVMVVTKVFEPSPWQTILQLLMNFGPFLLIVVFWFVWMNRMQSGGAGGALNFGKSRAKMLTPGQGRVTFADVAGVDEAKEELQEIIEFLKEPTKFQKLGGKIPKGVLLLGPPGTGKTLLARAVAGEAGRPFFSISGSDFVEMFVGVGASRVRDLFEQGKKNAPCIIFIDEIDAVGRHRGAGLGGGHDEREQTLNALLVEMDGFESNKGVILVAATNRPDVLDPALTRPGRFDRQVVVDRPDIKGREGVLRVHSKNVILSPDVDMKVLARRTPGFSGADLANLVNEGALLAARRDKKAVGMKELEDAVDRVLAGPERKTRVMSDEQKKVIAYHESGHALVAKLTPGSDPVHKVSIIPRGMGVLGYVMQLPIEDRFVVQKEEILAKITVSLGGRASEEIIFGDVSTGAGNDLEYVTETAHRMVCEYGMSEKLGRVTYGRKDREVFLGRDIVKDKDYSEKTAQAIDQEVKKIVEAAYQRAKAILVANKSKLVKLANTLLEKEMIEGSDLDALLGLKSKTPAPAV